MLVTFFNRPKLLPELLRRVAAARPRAVYLACDGPRDGVPEDQARVAECRRIAGEFGWGCPVRTRYLERNDGCAVAVSGAVSWFFEQEPGGIVLEDDCLPSPDFFPFATELLERYRDDERVMSISGTSFVPRPADETGLPSYRFLHSPSVWGWASWRRAWQRYRLNLGVEEVRSLRRRDLPADSAASLRGWRKRLGSCVGDAPHTWDYQWSYAHFRSKALAIVPMHNLVTNVADESGTHMGGSDPWQGLPSSGLRFPLEHPETVAADARADRYVERVHCNHRPWLARKAWQLARRHGLATPEALRSGFDPDRFLANLHGVLAAAWLCALGIGAAPESIVFACLCAVTALRLPTILRQGMPRSVALPLAIWAAFVGWMALSVSWSETSLAVTQALPGRLYLGPLLVIPARLSARIVLVAVSIPGAWWSGVLACGAAGLAMPGWVTPRHPSATFAGIQLLAVASLSISAATEGWRTRVLAWSGLALSLAGSALSMSRATTVAIGATALVTFAGTARDSRSLVLRLALLTAAASAMAAVPPLSGIRTKFTTSIEAAWRSLDEANPSEGPALIESLDKLSSGRGTLHAWTAVRIPDHPVIGHGAKSWADNFAEQGIASRDALVSRTQFGLHAGQRYFAHQLYLQTVYEYGAVGLALMASFAVACVQVAWRTRWGLASIAVLTLVCLVSILGFLELQPGDRTHAYLAVVLLALVAGLRPMEEGARREAWRFLGIPAAAGAAAALAALSLAMSVRHVMPADGGPAVFVPDERFQPEGNLLADSAGFPGSPWVPVAAGRARIPVVSGHEVRFDAGGAPSTADRSFIELPIEGLRAGDVTTFSFSVRGPRGSSIAAGGAAGADVSRIPLDGEWQRVHLTETATERVPIRLRIGLGDLVADGASLPSRLAVEVRDPQLVIGSSRIPYQETRGTGASRWPLRTERSGPFPGAPENRLRWSDRVDVMPWRTFGLAKAEPFAASDPIGGNSAVSLVEDRHPGTHGVEQAFECTMRGAWTLTAYVAPQARGACRVELLLPGYASIASFDLESKQALATSTAEPPDAHVESIGYGWCRIVLRGRATSEGPAAVRLLTLARTDGDGTHEGDGRGALLAWGIGVEPGNGTGVHVPTAFRPRSASGGDPRR